jgi:hypothetical protein
MLSRFSLSLFLLCLARHTGYRKYYAALRDYLVRNARHPSLLKVVGKEDRGRTGNFEVTVAGTGQVLHSKRHAGQGRAESEASKRLILDQVNELVEEILEEEDADEVDHADEEIEA